MRRTLTLLALLLGFGRASGDPLAVRVSAPAAPEGGYFKMGTDRNPAGDRITLDARSLLWNGGRWLPVMGEFHYSRYPAAEWREELLKMKAGRVDIVATYVFWIHHEEIAGQWNWSGQRDLRQFVELAREAGLKVVVRCGPWCHGEVRNGGLPEWVVEHKDWKLRSTDERFLAAVRELYGQITRQLQGLLWKDGGPVVGIQLDNEYRGPAEYLLALKQIARDVGLDVPLYTRTGWPALTTPMPLGEIAPLFGGYAEGFWDRELTAMPGRYWTGFHFSTLRTDAAIATEMLGNREAHDDADVIRYPYLTCEIGGGMMNSYHRRIRIDPRDVEANAWIKLGGGSAMLGYYMYHGGTNPDGQGTTLMEAQATAMTNYNDLPVKTYDFQAPLGEFGEVRPHYHSLRRLHWFLNDNGADLAGMPVFLPERRPAGKEDVTTLRWAVRSDGHSGYVFVNNHERGRVLPAKAGVQFAITLDDGSTLMFPQQPVEVASDVMFGWPFNSRHEEFTLAYATALPFGHILEEGANRRTLFFAATPGVPAELAFDAASIVTLGTKARTTREGGRFVLHDVRPSRDAFVRFTTKKGRIVQCVLLDEADSLSFWKGPVGDRNHVVLTPGDVVFDRGEVRVKATAAGATTVALFPVPERLTAGGREIAGEDDGIFRRYALHGRGLVRQPVTAEPVRAAGPLRTIKPGPIKQPVAMEPTDADFAAAAVWRLKLPGGIDMGRSPLLVFDYVGDVARITLNGRLLTDDFYNGRPKDLGLWRYEPAIRGGELQFAVLPLQQDAPIYRGDARPDFHGAASVGVLRKVELETTDTFTLRVAAP